MTEAPSATARPLSLRDCKRDDRPQRFGWAPGNYICRCIKCEAGFIGDKRACHCADCAYAMPDTALQDATAVNERETLLKRIAELEAALRPFAEKANDYDCVYESAMEQIRVSRGDLRRARAALSPQPEGK